MDDTTERRRNLSDRRFLRYADQYRLNVRGIAGRLGPGLITGAADDDPCAIGTYVKAGASLGFSALWLAPVTLPMMAAVVYLSAKIGLVSGVGLAGVLRTRYRRAIVYPMVLALLVANVIGAGADIGAIAAAVQLVIPIHPLFLILLITASILVLQIWGSYRLIRSVFKWFSLALLSYVGAALMARPDAASVFRGTFIPTATFDKEFLSIIVAVIGTTLSPYLYFWQASQQVEEEIAVGRRRLLDRQGTSKKGALRFAAWDINIGMFFSSMVMYFVILCAAATLHRAGHTDVESAAAAASALRPLAGNAAGLLFAIGIAGAGLLAIPVLTTAAAYALADTFGWRSGLHENPRRAPQFYAVIAASTVIAMGLNFYGANPIKALFTASIIMGFIAVPLLIAIMRVTGDAEIMGPRVNGRPLAILGWITTGCVCAAAVALVVSWVVG
jgi:NRAMP (natural resistance-associated macrophage protein)-like metal ion transporter